MKRVLVLGGGGFIGRHLLNYLSDDYAIRVFDYQTMHLRIEFPNAELISGTFAEANFEALLEGVDIVYHLISTTVASDGTENACKELKDNVLPTIRLLDAMTEKGTERIIFVSSAGTIYGDTIEITTEKSREDPLCTYGVQKLCIEKYLSLYERYHGFCAITARLTNPYGTGQNPHKKQGVIPIFARAILTDSPIEIWGDGSVIRDYINIEDAARGLFLMANYNGPNRLFNISSGEEWSLMDIISMLENEIGKKANVIFKDARKCDIRRSSVDSSLFRRETGWKPKYSLKNGIDQLVRSLS